MMPKWASNGATSSFGEVGLMAGMGRLAPTRVRTILSGMDKTTNKPLVAGKLPSNLSSFIHSMLTIA